MLLSPLWLPPTSLTLPNNAIQSNITIISTILILIIILITTTILPRSVSNSVPHVDLLRTKLGRLHRPSSPPIKIANLGSEKSWGTCNLWEGFNFNSFSIPGGPKRWSDSGCECPPCPPPWRTCQELLAWSQGGWPHNQHHQVSTFLCFFGSKFFDRWLF